ncbi:hypothetical protein Tco_0656385 [Tanacetum coccineum]|uniref:Uncharacterized protein n=1 Tax=Tanacetum coccineum TaxID=301880 RepID=A0ABQ4X8M6_9ASTR
MVYPTSWIRRIGLLSQAIVLSSSKSIDTAYASRMIRCIDVRISRLIGSEFFGEVKSVFYLLPGKDLDSGLSVVFELNETDGSDSDLEYDLFDYFSEDDNDTAFVDHLSDGEEEVSVRREFERIKQIKFSKPVSPGPGLIPEDAMLVE